MQRRNVVAGLGFALLYPTLASAQSGPASDKTMGDAETQHMKRTMTVGSLSLATSRIALKKATDADVKEFAQFEVAEQETIADILKSMKDGSVSGTVKAPSESEVEANLDADGKAMLQKLEAVKAGATFDKDYVKGQIDGHDMLLKIQEDYLASGKNPQAIAVAKLARGMIKEHLTLLKDLQENLG